VPDSKVYKCCKVVIVIFSKYWPWIFPGTLVVLLKFLIIYREDFTGSCPSHSKLLFTIASQFNCI